MADQHSEKFLLGIDVEMQMKKAAKQVSDFEKQLTRMTKLPDKFKKAEKKALTDFTKGLEKSKRGIKDMQKSLQLAAKDTGALGKAAKQQSKEMEKFFEEAKDASNELRRTVNKNRQEIAALEKKLRKSSSKEEKKQLEEQLSNTQARAKAEINAKRRLYAAKKRDLDKGLKSTGAAGTLKAHAGKSSEFKKLQDEAVKAGKSLDRATHEAVAKMRYGLLDVGLEFSDELLKGVNEAIDSLKGKDLVGVGKGLGTGLLNSLKAGGKGMAKWGETNKGAGGITGAAAGGINSMVKGISGIMKALGPTLGSLAKMGPLLSTMSATVVGLVKLLLDVEAAGKEINKELMEGGSLLDTFAATGYRAEAGYQRLQDTLQAIKDQTHDIGMNFAMGTNAKEHMGVINVLKQEGVTLEKLRTQLEDNKKAASSTIREMTKFTDVTSQAIGFSRLFGVSLDEIGTLQGELMSELAMNIGDVKLEFSRMADAAAESGIAANKFFNILRGVSADMSLFGMRMKDVSKSLALMGKSMSPRTAQKFMQTLSQGFKGQSMTDRLKTALIGGSKVTGAAQEDVTEKMSDLLNKVVREGRATSTADAAAKLKSGAIKGDEREAFLRLQRRQGALSKGGVLGTAAAMEEMGPAAVHEARKAAMLRFSGAKNLKDVTSLGMLATEQATGMSTEDQTQAMLFEESLNDQRNALKDAFAKQAAGTANADDRKLLAKAMEAGITNSGLVDSASTNKLYKTMDQAEEDQKKKADEQLKAAYESGQLTQSMLQKMDVVIDAIFNWLYKVLLQLWDVVLDIASSRLFDPTGSKKAEREKAKIEVEVSKTRNKELMDTLQSSGSAGEFHKKLFSTSVNKDMESSIYGASGAADKWNKKKAELEQKLGSSSTSASEKEKLKKEYDAGQKEYEAATGKFNTAIRVINTQLGGTNNDATLKADRMRAAFIDSRGGEGNVHALDENKLLKARSNLEKGQDIYQAMTGAGFSEEETAKVLDKIRIQLSPQQLAKAFGDYASETKKDGSASPGASPAPGTPVVASTSGGAPVVAATPAVGATPKPPPQSEGDSKQGEELIKGNEAIHDALRQQGVKMDKSFLKTTYEKSVQDAVLDAARQALFEYALYTAKDPKSVLDRMGKSGFGRVGEMAGAFLGDAKNADFLGTSAPHATGGVVSAINNGMAVISPAPGEGMASIGKGETIVPKGGGGRGGDTFQINVNGIGGNDLARHLREKVSEIVYEYKRREKFG